MTSLLSPYESIPLGISDSAIYAEKELNESFQRLRMTESVGLGRAIFDELYDVFEECRVADWDGYNALPVVLDTYLNAKSFLDALPDSVPAPTSIGAEPDGDLEMEWYRSTSHLLSISISPDSRLSYAAAFGNERHNGTVQFSTYISETILYLIRKTLV